MARSIETIWSEIISAKEREAGLAALSSTSATAIWRLWAYITAVAIYTLERLFDTHVTDINAAIANLKPHSLRWYAGVARRYRHGQALLPESDQYSDEGLTAKQIATSQVVSYAAVVEQERGLRIKVARTLAGDLAALSTDQFAGFTEYMTVVKDAGVRLLITSGPADGLKLSLDVYYNPLVLNAAGERLDGNGSMPVADAVQAYLRNLPFNGVFVLAYLVDALQAVDGVVVPHVVSASARYGALPYQGFGVEYQPDSGYLRFETPGDLVIRYLPKTPMI